MFYACNALFYGQGAEGWKNAGERKKFAALLEERVKALKGKEDTSGRTMTVGEKECLSWSITASRMRRCWRK